MDQKNFNNLLPVPWVDRTSDQTIGGEKTFTEVVTVPAGTATTPGITFVGHSASGISATTENGVENINLIANGGRVTVPAGTATTPGITFVGHSTSGMSATTEDGVENINLIANGVKVLNVNEERVTTKGQLVIDHTVEIPGLVSSIVIQRPNGFSLLSFQQGSAGYIFPATPDANFVTLATTNDVNAVNVSAVHKSGDETIEGVKTFTSHPVSTAEQTDYRKFVSPKEFMVEDEGIYTPTRITTGQWCYTVNAPASGANLIYYFDDVFRTSANKGTKITSIDVVYQTVAGIGGQMPCFIGQRQLSINGNAMTFPIIAVGFLSGDITSGMSVEHIPILGSEYMLANRNYFIEIVIEPLTQVRIFGLYVNMSKNNL